MQLIKNTQLDEISVIGFHHNVLTTFSHCNDENNKRYIYGLLCL